MMNQKRKALSPELARTWAGMAHVFFIDALSTAAPLSLDKVTFQGGTNLHFSWGSPRYSEDLDFLVTREFGARINEIMPKVEKRMRALAAAVDPAMKIEIRNKTKNPDGMLNYRIVMTSPNVVGQVMAKAEFWQVEDSYLKDYEAQFVQPRQAEGMVSRVSQPIPAATLNAAFADKVVALAYRPQLKWRDLFDLWWITKQEKQDVAAGINRVLHHATAYQGDNGETLQQGLMRFLAKDPQEVIKSADPELKRWLPANLWATLFPEAVEEMVAGARRLAQDVLEALPEENCDENRKDSCDEPCSCP